MWAARPILAAACTLYMAAVLGVEINGFVELAAPAFGSPDGPGAVLLITPFLVCFGGPFALVASLLLVLPTVSAARWAGTRFTGRDAWWWVPVIASVVAAAGTAALGAAWRPGPGPSALVWLTGATLLTAAALVARRTALRGGRVRHVLGWGAVAAVAVFAIGTGVFATGLVPEYRPPRVDAAVLSGSWTDGEGGTLRLAADGTAHAEGLTDHAEAYKDDAEPTAAKYRCSGRGTWSYEAGDSTTWAQRVRIRIKDCHGLGEPYGWRIGGTPDRLELGSEYGEPDAPDWYALTRR
ncbi:hypothetical protein [Streptomyces sp. ML-6]|uniref:hypothetical protein n=1 Tax=Streptomyces sp. ML-6 TaxID=2982693 RepID=UPI0024BFDD39|nr:hypothetical protein [Streptomyces sp. ML-6]MDK0521348.1 hypothetical protein [Streptomyces sp. ML-6]